MKNHPDIDTIIARTRCWIERVVVELNLCPFARKPYEGGQVRYVVSVVEQPEDLLEDVQRELELLRATDAAEVETTVLIHPYVLNDFLDYNDFLGIVDALIDEGGYAGEFQVASLHPDYQFAGTEADDALARLEHDLRPTYLDVGVARVAAALAAAARGDEHAAAALSSAVDQVDATDDRVARAVFRLAEALGLEALGLPSSAEAANFTEYLLAELGIDAGGWRTTFGLILSGSAEASLAGRA